MERQQETDGPDLSSCQKGKGYILTTIDDIKLQSTNIKYFEGTLARNTAAREQAYLTAITNFVWLV